MLPVRRRRRRRRLPVVMPIVVVCWCLRIAGSCAWRSHSLVLPTRTRLVPKHWDGNLCAKNSDRTTNTNTEDDDGYQFGNITKGVLGKFQTEVNSLTGNSHYNFGDFSRWYGQQGKGYVGTWVEGFTDKAEYRFGDVSKELLRRFQTGQYTQDDVWLFLKIISLVGMNLQPVVAGLPVKVVMDMLEVSVGQQVSGKVAGMLSNEVEQRMKLFVTGDKDYQVGDFTKQAVLGKKEYEFGDLTKRMIQNIQQKDDTTSDADGTSYQFGDITKRILNNNKKKKNETISTTTPLQDDTATTKKIQQDLEAWDTVYLETKKTDLVSNDELQEWDEQFLASAAAELSKE